MKRLNWIISLCGLWEAGDILLPLVIGAGNVRIFVWGHIVAGIVLMIAGASAALAKDMRTARTMDWIAAVAGAWLIVFPLIEGIPLRTLAPWNDILVGASAFILSMLSARSVGRRG
jgi:hypothetical protein